MILGFRKKVIVRGEVTGIEHRWASGTLLIFFLDLGNTDVKIK